MSPLGLLLLILILSQWLHSCGLFEEPITSSTCFSNCNVSADTTEQPAAIGGKLAQSYVKEARVWADQLVAEEGNLEWEEGEPLALSGDAGDYELMGAAGEIMIVTSGGKKQNSSGAWIDALPMVAPAPEAGQTTTNVTPLTTLVAFEPELKEKLDALGGWNADIASPSGVSGNLLRIAKTVETLSSTISGGDSPVVSNFSTNLKSLGKLATELNSATGNLASDTVLKVSASSALTTIVSDPTLVPNPPADAQALVNSLEQAVEGITVAIPATDRAVVEDTKLLAQIEEVLENASIEETVSITVTMGQGLQFPPVIREITLSLEDDNTTLTLSAEVSDDNLSSLSYDWSINSTTMSLTNPTQPSAQISGFDNSNLQIFLMVTDPVSNVDIGACAWTEANPTVCNCMNNECN